MSVPKVEIFKIIGTKRAVVAVVGGKGKVKDVNEVLDHLREIAKKHGIVAQAFDACVVAGVRHLVHAARLATLAQEDKRGFANSLEVELICWTSAERQIGRAIKKIGLKSGKRKLAFVAIGDSHAKVKKALGEVFLSLGLKPAPKVLDLSREKEKKIREIFSISPRELGVIPLEKLVIERISLLELQR
jgi:tRNA threonylcarbamoyladenosine modification (KEOPS) complex Cgi121 subunit